MSSILVPSRMRLTVEHEMGRAGIFTGDSRVRKA
jgi:hypothetical protein